MSASIQTKAKKKKPNWFIQFVGSTLGRKLLMGLTGLFLILFLTVHLIGNLQLLQLFYPDNGKAFNLYAEFMGHNEIIQIISKGNFFFIFLHIVISLLLTLTNRKARPVAYAYNKPSANSIWTSRNMGILGTIILIFLVVHLQNFYAQMKWGVTPMVEYDGKPYKDLYALSVEAFSQLWLVALYVVSMLALAFHLSHGFQSAFQTIGLNHKKYTPFIKTLGLIYSIGVPAGFALIPIITYLQNVVF